MNLAIFGGTGLTGRLLVAQAIEAGHAVRVLSRTPGADLPIRAVQVSGSVLDAAAVRDTILGADAVLSCLGAPLMSTWSPRGRIAAAGTRAIIAAMQDAFVARLVCVSVFGAGDSWRLLRLDARLLLQTVMRGELADKNDMEDLVRASGLDWTILRPVNLVTNSRAELPSSQISRIGLDSRVGRATLARAMLEAIGDASSVGRARLVT